MVPQAGAVTPVGQVTVQVTAMFVFPVTTAANCWVVFVITLAVGVVIAMVTLAALLLLLQPATPSAIARVHIKLDFHHLITVLPTFLIVK